MGCGQTAAGLVDSLRRVTRLLESCELRLTESALFDNGASPHVRTDPQSLAGQRWQNPGPWRCWPWSQIGRGLSARQHRA